MTSIPPPALNGGLYTGDPFKPGAPYANVPLTPDAGFLTNVALRTANPPPGATEQHVIGLRPGNNRTVMNGLEYDADNGLLLVSGPQRKTVANCKFTKYAYLEAPK